MLKIILIGYMGVGKTTIAQLLSEKIKIKWLDLDETIEKHTQVSIKTIFEERGEIYFRKVEHQLFKKITENEEKLIVSTGGGTPCYANNHLLLNGEKVVSIYLKASVETIFERVKNEKTQRPLIANVSENELKEFIAKNLFERSYYYNQAKHIINIDGKSPDVITNEIYALLH